MSPWAILLIPVALCVLTFVLLITAWIEEVALSPRSLILRSARVRGADPNHVETFVAAQYERMLRENGG